MCEYCEEKNIKPLEDEMHTEAEHRICYKGFENQHDMHFLLDENGKNFGVVYFCPFCGYKLGD